MEKIDRKFRIQAVNATTGKTYDETDSLLLCAKDLAVPVASKAYIDECNRIGAKPGHIASAQLLLDRVIDFQRVQESHLPDTSEAELLCCLQGVNTDDQPKGHWQHCSPALLASGVSCADTLRRDCQCVDKGSHDHFILA